MYCSHSNPTTPLIYGARWWQGANAQLRGRVQDLAAELQEAREELVALGGLQEQLAADVEGDVDVDALILAAVGRERAAQDARNSKVLELLKSKVSFSYIPHASPLPCLYFLSYCQLFYSHSKMAGYIGWHSAKIS